MGRIYGPNPSKDNITSLIMLDMLVCTTILHSFAPMIVFSEVWYAGLK